ncbi:hypothetical protein [Actinomadura napierensis]|uniref:Subtilisin inhibitor domain-containing protein n=1 Tax=Actinomadura napierensis TaxID=267854 RepID=A0ABP5M5T9_9ACTN
MLSCLRILAAGALPAATTVTIAVPASASATASAADRARRPDADYVCSDLVLSPSGFARGTTACKAQRHKASGSGDIHGTFTLHGVVQERAKPVTVTCKPDPDLPKDPSGAYVREVFGFHCS